MSIDVPKDDEAERYFLELFAAGWAAIEHMMTKSQIEQSVSFAFIHGFFVASIVACVEDEHISDHPALVARREALYKQFGGLQGVIGELIRRLELDWSYVPLDQRTEEDWMTPNVPWLNMGLGVKTNAR